jgi:hypothetical protein
MNKQTVGMENLPNIYIEKINLLYNGLPRNKQYAVKVSVMMYDNAERPTWHGRIDDLKFKLTFVRDERITSLNEGEMSLYDFSPGLVDSTIVESCSELNHYFTEKGYKYFRKTFEVLVTRPENLNVYVSCFIDDLSFGIDQFDKFYGPMAGEKIFVGGQINKETGYFYYPDTNEEYAGPVHVNGQTYMEGSEHTTRQHSALRYVQEDNYKITSTPEITLEGVVDFRTGFDLSMNKPPTGLDVNDSIYLYEDFEVEQRDIPSSLKPQYTNPLEDLEIVDPSNLIILRGGY